MPRDPKKGNQKRSREQRDAQKSAVSWLHQSPQWPVYEVLLSENWTDEKEMVTALVARQSPRSGKIAVASFLIDLRCLGVKIAFVRICKSPEDYQRRVLRRLKEDQTLSPAELDLVAKIIAEGVAYAGGLGFSPDPEYHQAQRLLAGANPAACDVDIPLGSDEGKPHYMAGPHDNVEAILATLTRAVGEDGFFYTQHYDEPARMPSLAGLFGME